MQTKNEKPTTNTESIAKMVVPSPTAIRRSKKVVVQQIKPTATLSIAELIKELQYLSNQLQKLFPDGNDISKIIYNINPKDRDAVMTELERLKSKLFGKYKKDWPRPAPLAKFNALIKKIEKQLTVLPPHPENRGSAKILIYKSEDRVLALHKLAELKRMLDDPSFRPGGPDPAPDDFKYEKLRNQLSDKIIIK